MNKVKVVELKHKEFKRLNKLYNGKLKSSIEDGKYSFRNVLEEGETVHLYDADVVKDLEEYGATVSGEEVTVYSTPEDATKIATGVKLTFTNDSLLKTDGKENKAPVVLDGQGEPVYTHCTRGVHVARKLANLPGNHLTPTLYTDEIKDAFSELPHTLLNNVRIKVLNKTDLVVNRFNTLLSVAQGSDEEPRVVVIEYKGNPSSDEFKMAYVGKGVTFDSGGISLKPGSKMHEMKMDMGGSAAVVGAMLNIVESQPEVNVVAIVGLVENMPSGKAIKPGDVVTSMSGKTVENHNTDAEGRLVLCDLITYIQNEYESVDKIVDIATLTGAIVVSLADQYAGLFTNSTEFGEKITDTGAEHKERYWRMPMGKEFAKQLDSNVADMKNIGNGHPGSTTAAEFLYKFVNDGVAWAHLDIAGTGMIGGKGTGFGVRTLTHLAGASTFEYPIDEEMKY